MMMEEVEDTNGESTFEFVGEPKVVLPVEVSSVAIPEPTVPVIPPLPSLLQTANPELVPLEANKHISSPIPTVLPSVIMNTESLIPQELQHGLYSSKPEPIIFEPVKTSSNVPETMLNIDESTMMMKEPQIETRSVWGWFTNSTILNKFAEKAKNSVDTMITTLDPGMKEIIYSGGNIDMIVASEKDIKVVPVREAFQSAFGRATVRGSPADLSNMAPQPVGFSSAIKSAEERINTLQLAGCDAETYVAIEGFLVEMVPDRWYDMSCLILRDRRFDSDLQVFTQPTPVPPEYIAWLQDSTPPDYPLLWSGFAKTVGEAAVTISGLDSTQWHEAVTGISRRELIVMASKALAGMYKLAQRNS